MVELCRISDGNGCLHLKTCGSFETTGWFYIFVQDVTKKLYS